MTGTVKSIIKVVTPKSGKKQARVTLPTKKGSREAVLSSASLSKELAERLLKAPQDLEGVNVEIEMENGLPARVWEKGQSWQAATPPPAKPGSNRVGKYSSGERRGSRNVGNRPLQSQQRDQQPRANLGEFENPYNFIPTPPRALSGDQPLGDHAPLGHHRYHPEHWSGRIQVQLTTRTPLLIPDAAKFTTDQGHSTFGMCKDASGAPYLPPTSIKGMLRSAYEAVTNSRMGVWEKHDASLPFRMPPTEGLHLVPARIERHGDTFSLRLLPGEAAISADGRPEVTRTNRVNDRTIQVRLMYGAWLSRYQQYRPRDRTALDKGESRRAKRYGDSNQLPEHTDFVHVRLSRNEHRSGRFDFLKVDEIQKAKPDQPVTKGWHAGWVCITGRNIMNKHDERVFLNGPNTRQLPLCSDIISRYEQLICNYQEIHEKELKQRASTREPHEPDDYLGHEPGRTGWSSHVSQKEARHVQNGTLCYARIVKDGAGKLEVKALYPVMISRDLYEKPPADLLDASLKPASRLDELSPADRVFGWVRDDGRSGKAKKDKFGAFRGQLRVGPVRCAQGADAIEPLGNHQGAPGLPLAILGQPKPQQARFYTSNDKQGTPYRADQPKKAAYAKPQQQGLRGRKVYPHQQATTTIGQYWDLGHDGAAAIERDGKKHYQEFRRQPDPEHQNRTRDDQNRSITEWIGPQTDFHFDLQISNLSTVELGALLWLLSLDDTHYLRLGYGKPLGFGSVQLKIEGIDLRNGQAMLADYRALIFRSNEGGRIREPTAVAVTEAITAFKQAVSQSDGANSFEATSFIKAFKNACVGSQLPMHYPRKTSGREGTDRQGNPQLQKTYEWFVANDKDNRSPRHPLPSLADEQRGLPYFED